MNIFITGAAGYVGSHVANFLSEKGHRVVGFDNLSSGFRESLNPKVKLIVGDILNFEALSCCLLEHQIEFVFHFAGKLSPEESIFNPLLYYENNVIGTLNLLKACGEHQIRHLIFSSSSNVYGNQKQGLLSEEQNLQPVNPYGQSKKMAEQMIKDFSKKYDLKYKILRFFNVAGATTDLKNGQRSSKAYHIIHRASQTALGLHPDIRIFGTDYPTEDGTCIRDYIHIEDLVELNWMCFQDLLQNGANEIFNCGYGRGYSVQKIIQTMQAISTRKFQIFFADRRAGDVSELVANTKLLFQKFPTWKPKKDDLQFICKSALDWEIKLRMN